MAVRAPLRAVGVCVCVPVYVGLCMYLWPNCGSPEGQRLHAELLRNANAPAGSVPSGQAGA